MWLPIATICIGVSITGATDFKLNKVGFLYALMNIVCTSFYQIWCANLQKALNANPLQLQMYIAPLSALFIIPTLPIFDNYGLSKLNTSSIFHVFPLPMDTILAIVLSGVLAVCVNISIFLLIGKTSAVTYNVVGNGKTAFLLLIDFVVFGRPFVVNNFVGLCTTLGGVMWYTKVKLGGVKQAALLPTRTAEEKK